MELIVYVIEQINFKTLGVVGYYSILSILLVIPSSSEHSGKNKSNHEIFTGNSKPDLASSIIPPKSPEIKPGNDFSVYDSIHEVLTNFNVFLPTFCKFLVIMGLFVAFFFCCNFPWSPGTLSGPQIQIFPPVPVSNTTVTPDTASEEEAIAVAKLIKEVSELARSFGFTPRVYPDSLRVSDKRNCVIRYALEVRAELYLQALEDAGEKGLASLQRDMGYKQLSRLLGVKPTDKANFPSFMMGAS